MIDEQKILSLLARFKQLGIAEQIDYKKFYLYSIITHSTAIEGSTITEVENQLLFDEGIVAPGRTLSEQLMNIDLKAAYLQAIDNAKHSADITKNSLCHLASLVMKNTGSKYSTLQGEFDSSKGDLRLVNVSAGVGGRSYMNFTKVPARLAEFCEWLNAERKSTPADDILAAYRLSFLAHYRLVTIHPWVDGNGRMARLLMNQLQWEKQLIPTIIYKEHKLDYINSLIKTRETDDESIFCEFMFSELTHYLQHTISEFEQSQDI